MLGSVSIDQITNRLKSNNKSSIPFLKKKFNKPNIINWENVTPPQLDTLYSQINKKKQIKHSFCLSFLSSFLLSSLSDEIVDWINTNNPFKPILNNINPKLFKWIDIPVLVVPENEYDAEIRYFLVGYAASNKGETVFLPEGAKDKIHKTSKEGIQDAIKYSMELLVKPSSIKKIPEIIIIPLVNQRSPEIKDKSLGLPFALGIYLLLQHEQRNWPIGLYATGELPEKKNSTGDIKIEEVGKVSNKYSKIENNFDLFLYPYNTPNDEKKIVCSSLLSEKAKPVHTLRNAFSEVKFFLSGQRLPNVNDDLRLVNPVSKIKCIYPKSIDSPDMPYEVGSVLGLDRGNYIALIDAPMERIHSSLIRSERRLHEALEKTSEKNQKKLNLPVRWWIRLAFDPYPPKNKEGIAHFFKFEEDNFLPLVRDNTWLENVGDRTQIIPGILFTISAIIQDTEDCIKQWCTCLRDIYKDYPLAIVVSFELGKNSHRSMKKTHHILSTEDAISFPIVCLHEFSAGNKTACAESKEEKIVTASNRYDFDCICKEKNDEEKINVLWHNLLVVFDRVSKEDKTKLKNYKQLGSLYNLLREIKKIPINIPQEINYQDLVEALRTVLPEELDKESLAHEFLEICPPQDLKEFILALARCQDEEIRKVTLSFVFQNPPCLNWWIEGTRLKKDLFPDATYLHDLLPRPQRTPLIEHLALGLMRFINETPDESKQKNALNLLQEEYLSYLRGVPLAFAEQIISGNKELPTNGYLDEILRVAFKISFDVIPKDTLLKSNLESSISWWYILAGNLDVDDICKLISLPSSQRAAIGLIDPFGEFPGALTDNRYKKATLDRRRGMPIFCTQQYPKKKRRQI